MSKTADHPRSQSASLFNLIKSYESFEKYLARAVSMRVVSYCTSPKMLLELFEDYELEELEVVVGEKTDFRQEIKSAAVAKKLERLKREGKLRIFLSPDRDLHSKLYIIETVDDETIVLNGSPNLTRTAWSGYYQINCIDEFVVDQNSERYRAALDAYQSHLEYCDDEPFLEDLTRELESSDEPEEDVIERWLAVNEEPSTNEVRRFHREVTQQLGQMGPEVEADETIRESLREYEDRTRKQVEKQFRNFEATVTNTTFQTSIGEYGRSVSATYDFPKMWVGEDGLHLITPKGRHIEMTRPLPPPEQVREGLANVEAYIESIDRHAQTDDPEAAKAHLFEALLYLFWAPFINQYASAFGAGEVSGMEKSLPFLYIHGEPNAGKGTFLEFGLRLISDNTVTSPIDGRRVTGTTPDAAREPVSAFPVALDDVERAKFDQLGGLRNYWKEWNGDLFPAIILTSNENKPKDWFMKRAKMVHFKLMFPGITEAWLETRRIIEADNDLFKWFSYQFLEKPIRITDLKDTQSNRDDVLAQVRETYRELYEYAEETPPDYFPQRPAEWEHDVGRVRWQEGYENGYYSVSRRNGQLVASFDDTFAGYEIDNRFKQNLPQHIRATRSGSDIWITSGAEFEEWLGRSLAEPDRGVLSRVRSRLSGS
ncbi:uncharacterized protein HfgLR_09310 [Haloferax gibbonsii]|uniref:PLD phosphodiesterase domain-containing protein n=1 Tax=Haloferax gibbonsii TaxID=35746 RepID=A0A871BH59_HALGI|nr:phospholipase D family protein [Haloferax gibbonsii]QOS12003.1 uncharacterized protein HfgLR_09310 [Haloferax gibbonsii]